MDIKTQMGIELGYKATPRDKDGTAVSYNTMAETVVMPDGKSLADSDLGRDFNFNRLNVESESFGTYEEARIDDAIARKSYIDERLLQFSTADLYFKAGGVMNQTKPTGTGTLISASALTTTEQLLFTFSYSAPQDFMLYANNRYLLNLPFQSMTQNRRIYNRYLYTIGADVIFDTPRAFVVPANGRFQEEFEQINNMTDNKAITAGTTIAFSIYGYTETGATPMQLLVNDINNMARLSRNEITAGQAATNVFTQARGVMEPQEVYNIELYSTIGDINTILATIVEGV